MIKAYAGDEDLTIFELFSLMGIKTRKEGRDTILTYPVAPEEAEYFALECSDWGGAKEVVFLELDSDVEPQVWADLIRDRLNEVFGVDAENGESLKDKGITYSVVL